MESAPGSKGIVPSPRIVDLLDTPGLDREIDPTALAALLTFGYVPAPRTILKGVGKRPPGDRRDVTSRSENEEESAETLRCLLQEAIRKDAGDGSPPGVLLSGGLDSSAIVAMMAGIGASPIRTFSIGFEEPSYDERRFARMVAEKFGTIHEERIMKPPTPDLIEELVACLDEPLGDLGLLSTFMAAKLAAEHVRAVFSGEGSDELFGGYDCHVAARMDRFYGALPRWVRKSFVPGVLAGVSPREKKRGLLNSAKRFAEGAALPRRFGHLRWRMLTAGDLLEGFDGWDPLSALGREGVDLSRIGLQEALLLDMETYLPDAMLAKATSAARAHSLEIAFPFLEDRLVEFACGLPAGTKLRGFTRKYILKKAMKGLLPDTILNRKKEGFSVPIKQWLRKELKPFLTDVLSERRIRNRGLVQPAAVTRLIDEHLSGSANHSHILWTLMILEIWCDRYL